MHFERREHNGRIFKVYWSKFHFFLVTWQSKIGRSQIGQICFSIWHSLSLFSCSLFDSFLKVSLVLQTFRKAHQELGRRKSLRTTKFIHTTAGTAAISGINNKYRGPQKAYQPVRKGTFRWTVLRERKAI